MNLHFPQTYEARAEASLLMGLKSNLITPRSGEPLVAAIQDFITAAYVLTHKDTFLTKSEFQRMAASLVDINEKKNFSRIYLPSPAIRKPAELWTGKQVSLNNGKFFCKFITIFYRIEKINFYLEYNLVKK